MPGQVSVETSPNATPLWILVAGTDNGSGSNRLPSHTPSVSRSKLTERDKTHIDESSLDNPDPGPFLTRGTVTSRDNPNVALDYATKSIERGPGLELRMSLERFEEVVPVLERSIEVPDIGNGSDHLAKISHSMHQDALGDSDHRVAETSRYLAEALVQVMQFDEAQNLCKKALEIHKEHSAPASLEDSADHWLMALVCEAKADYEYALVPLLVLASMSLIANNQENESATIVVCVGNIYLSLCRFDEAIFSYQKALAVFKSTKGKNQPSVASVFFPSY